MIEFPYSLFSDAENFPLHIQYGYHEEELYQHSHADFSELVIVISGTANHVIGCESYPISKGSVFVVGPHTEHGFEQTNHLTICNVLFLNEVFGKATDMKYMSGFQALFVLEPHYSKNYHFTSQFILPQALLDEVKILVNELLQECRQKDLGWQDIMLSGFYMLCVKLSRAYQLKAESSNAVQQLANATAYIENHFAEHITYGQLAAISGYSERQFLRLFKEAYSVAPIKYINDLRIKKAQQLLRSTALSIGEIAWSCGWDDQNYFTRLFKKTPTLRQQHIEIYFGQSIINDIIH